MEERSAVQMENVQPYDTICGLAKVHPTVKHKNSFVILPARGHGPSFTVTGLHISRQSDTYRGKERKYGGIIIYSRKGETEIGILQTTPTAKADMW